MTRKVDICLISPGLPTSNPRLVKEAEALVRAGYSVHCIVGDYATPLREHDAALIAGTGATMTIVGLGSRAVYLMRRARQIAVAAVLGAWCPDRFLAMASSTQSLLLAAEASAIRARLYIGHNLPALPAAVMAATKNRAVAGFDAEDCHSVESYDPHRNRIASLVEQRFLSRCRHLTAASPLIATEYRQRYGVAPISILNTFDAPSAFNPTDNLWTGDRPLSLYWFSQTIGPGRGLEQVITAAGRARSKVALVFRGSVDDGYRNELLLLGQRAGLKNDVQFLAPAHPNQMIPCAAKHDVGLSLELSEPRNHDLCLANKLFTYLAAGRPQILSGTLASREICGELGAAAVLIDLQDISTVAAAIDRFAESPLNYAIAAEEARRLYNERFSWREESRRLIDAVANSLNA